MNQSGLQFHVNFLSARYHVGHARVYAIGNACVCKQLLDEVFVISGIIKVDVSVINRAEG